MPAHHIIPITLATLALSAPAAVAQPIGTDRDTGTPSITATSTPAQDLRSPDARDAAQTNSLAGTTSAPRQDLRSPDTRDAAAGHGTFNAPDVTVVKLPRPTPAASDGGTDWRDVGIGAASALFLALLVLAATIAITQRRQRARRIATTA